MIITDVTQIKEGVRLVEAEAFTKGGLPFAVHEVVIAVSENERFMMSDDLRDGTGGRGPRYRVPLVRKDLGVWVVRVVREKEYLELKNKEDGHPARGQFDLKIPGVGEDGMKFASSVTRSQREDFSHLHTADDEKRLRKIETVEEYRKLLTRWM